MMILKNFSLSIILLISTASYGASSGMNCLQASRFVLFTKAINTINQQYQQYLYDQYEQGHYSSFEYLKVKKDSTTILPKSICSEDILISLGQFKSVIIENCLREQDQEKVKLYTREIASDITNDKIKNSLQSIHKSKLAALAELESLVDQFKRCNNKEQYTRSIASLNLYAKAKNICFKIIDIINKTKNDRAQCQ